jgi:hypothetical protein
MFSSNTTQVSDGGYQISRSLRFNKPDSAYLNRTPASAGNRQTWTLSCWMKKSLADAFEGPFRAGDFLIYFSSDVLKIEDTAGVYRATTQVFRDYSAWYHFVFVVDTTNATANNRIRIYVNGSEITAFTTLTNPTQNLSLSWNNNINHNIGTYSAGTYQFGGYMTDVNFIDGQALTPSSFGETDTQTGVWKPKAYSGSYGTNGFYLNFSDNSNTTAATLGADYSGNGNNFTPNNFSVTAGAGNDSLVDSPTSYGTDTGVGGTVRGNYCTLNRLFVPLAGINYFALSNGNLDIAGTSSADSGDSIGTMSTGISGKYYFEVNITGIDGTGYGMVGASDINQTLSAPTYNFLGYLSKSYGYNSNGTKANNNTNPSYGSSYTTGDVIGVAIDCDNGAIYFSKNNTWQNSGVPTSGASRTGAAFTWTGGSQDMVPQMAVYKTGTILSDNFGQRPFAYTAPSGFKALCTQNLPTPTIGATTATQAGKFFNPVLYTGTGGTRSVTGVGFQPDWTWLKARSTPATAGNHFATDAVRGAGMGLYPNLTDAEGNNTTLFTAFASDGFNLAGANGSINENGVTYVAWNWKANGSGSTNTAGSITSTVSASTTSGFSIVTYTGNGTAGATVGHGLSAVPQMIIVKCRDTAFNWRVYQVGIGNVNSLLLNSDGGFTSLSSWNSTTPTSTVFSLGTDVGTNQSGSTFVAYCFAPIAGYSAFGSYTGNGSTDGPFIYCGFRPAYVLIKGNNTSNWFVMDATRSTYNVVMNKLYPNDNGFERTSTAELDLLSNGFKMRVDDATYENQNGTTYIFMAFASNPFKYALAR